MLIQETTIEKLNLASADDRTINGVLDLFFSILIAALITASFVMIIDNIYLLVLIFFCSRLLYFTFSEFMFSTTLGKLHTGTIVVNKAGGKITLKQAFVRSVVRIFTGLGSIMDDYPTALHDKLSNTYVIKPQEAKTFKLIKYVLAVCLLIVGIERTVNTIERGFPILGAIAIVGSVGVFSYRGSKK
jgi:uncharacterized RDD family membrane protein YckC